MAGHEHGHGHDHAHGHAHAHPSATRPFAIAMAINLGYTAVEAGYGFQVQSLALLSDALHNLGDALGLALAWGAALLAQRQPTARHTYGWRRATQLSPLANALLLVGFSGALLGESLRRFAAPPEVPGGVVMAVAALGILVDLGTAALFHRGQASDLNRRGAYLHLLADAAVSLAAVLAGLGMLILGWRWLDPALAAAGRGADRVDQLGTAARQFPPGHGRGPCPHPARRSAGFPARNAGRAGSPPLAHLGDRLRPRSR